MLTAALWVFLSYSHADRDAASKLRNDLQRAGCQVWMDPELKAGQNWTREIERALDKASTVVVLVSPTAYQSVNVRAEILRAQRKGKRIVPVIAVKGTDVPLPLEPLQWVPLTEAVEAVGCK